MLAIAEARKAGEQKEGFGEPVRAIECRLWQRKLTCFSQVGACCLVGSQLWREILPCAQVISDPNINPNIRHGLGRKAANRGEPPFQ